jgi:hypothetical protein
MTSKWAEGTLDKIRAAYERVAGCPQWDDLGPRCA